MKKKKLILVLAIIMINIVLIITMKFMFLGNAEVLIKSASENNRVVQLFYSESENFSEINSLVKNDLQANVTNSLTFPIPQETQFLRFDFSETNTVIVVDSISVNNIFYHIDLLENFKNNIIANDCKIIDNGSSITIVTGGEDPYIIFDTKSMIASDLHNVAMNSFFLASFLSCILFDLLMVYLIRRKDNGVFTLIRELRANKKLIWSLSKNDFRTKFAGSYFGIFWAFVQPIVTTMIYVFVFQIGFKAAPEGDYPYVLWLIAGIIPWFFFVEALINATNCLIEYSYLVKKVVFKISILPIVKIISSLFVHIFFIAFVFLIFMFNGKVPSMAIIQVVYYCFCIFMLVLSLSYLTLSIVPFFKDFSQIVSILTQIGMWMIPIMWNKNMLAAQFQWILKLNPMYYVVEGYRDSFIYGTMFWEKPAQTIYFWIVVFMIFVLGMAVFKRLKTHFSDVL